MRHLLCSFLRGAAVHAPAFLLAAAHAPAIAGPVPGSVPGSQMKPAANDISPPASTVPVFGTPAACAKGARGPAVLVTADGFRDRKGNLRIAVYHANEDEFLASGKYVERIDIPLTEDGAMAVCVPLPAPGPYAIVALHDRNTDGKLNVFSDGFGFSNNPKLGRSKPEVDKVTVAVNGINRQAITLNYVQGFSPRPWRFFPKR